MLLSNCYLLESELTVPGMETISTRAKMKEHSILDRLVISVLQSSLKLTDLDQSLNLCYRFILLDKNNPRKQKSPSNLNIAPWGKEAMIQCANCPGGGGVAQIHI